MLDIEIFFLTPDISSDQEKLSFMAGFLDLPVEIRLEIYRMLNTGRSYNRTLGRQLTCSVAERFNSNLFAVNKQISGEAEMIFYGENIFHPRFYVQGNHQASSSALDDLQTLRISHRIPYIRKCGLYSSSHKESPINRSSLSPKSLSSCTTCKEDFLSRIQKTCSILSEVPALEEVEFFFDNQLGKGTFDNPMLCIAPLVLLPPHCTINVLYPYHSTAQHEALSALINIVRGASDITHAQDRILEPKFAS